MMLTNMMNYGSNDPTAGGSKLPSWVASSIDKKSPCSGPSSFGSTCDKGGSSTVAVPA
jgi:hypothetical protein